MGYRAPRAVAACLRIWTAAVAICIVGAALIGFSTQPVSAVYAQADGHQIKLVVHGGAGTITPDNIDAERQRAYEDKLGEALQSGYEVLRTGGSSLDAVVAAITILEDSPLFNAGRGAVLTSDGTAELDASVMEGRTRNAGAVASVTTVKNPIRLARLVMEQSRHVMLAGDGAESFAEEQGVELVGNEYFRTERRLQQYERYRQRLEEGADTGSRNDVPSENEHSFAPANSYASPIEDDLRKFGTVGAVALDAEGDLAAGTSTGGISYKRWGRIGDSPIIGAGTFADNQTCAISATGDGEYFIRGVVAHDISAMMRYAGLSLREAASAVIHGKLPEMGGTGGVIGLDRDGNVAMVFNRAGMFRGTVDHEGNIVVKMFGE